MSTHSQESACGYDFAEGKRYLVFVGDDFRDGSWNSGLCSGNVQNPSADILSILPNGYEPTSLSFAWIQLVTPLQCIAILAALVLIVGTITNRNRKRKMIPPTE